MERARLIFLLSFVVLSNYFRAKKICSEGLEGVFDEVGPRSQPPRTNRKVKLLLFSLFCKKDTTSSKVLHRKKKKKRNIRSVEQM